MNDKSTKNGDWRNVKTTLFSSSNGHLVRMVCHYGCMNAGAPCENHLQSLSLYPRITVIISRRIHLLVPCVQPFFRKRFSFPTLGCWFHVSLSQNWYLTAYSLLMKSSDAVLFVLITIHLETILGNNPLHDKQASLINLFSLACAFLLFLHVVSTYVAPTTFDYSSLDRQISKMCKCCAVIFPCGIICSRSRDVPCLRLILQPFANRFIPFIDIIFNASRRCSRLFAKRDRIFFTLTASWVHYNIRTWHRTHFPPWNPIESPHTIVDFRPVFFQ